ncbi:MAG TPA: ATP-binding protein [Gaiellaceae bacterium]
MRPLDFLTSIKKKLGVVIVAAVAVTVAIVTAGEHAGVSPILTGLVAAAAALAVVQLLAHGMTRPLREMVAAAQAMARGDYRRRVTATSRDEVGELARAFNSMAAELAEVDRMRRDLVANASHELRTPIGALRAVVENLADGVEPPSAETFATMLRQVDRLGTLVEQLLDLSRLESGATQLDREPLLVEPLLADVAAEWRAKAQGRDVELAVSVEPASLSVRADPARLHQVLANLVANAVRHARRGGRVEVLGSAVGRSIRLEVADDGPGISAAEIERVFERFYRADHGRAATEGGSGLGLAIARWIVELHGGTIRAEPAEPSGCRIVVELPT